MFCGENGQKAAIRRPAAEVTTSEESENDDAAYYFERDDEEESANGEISKRGDESVAAGDQPGENNDVIVLD